MEPQNPPDDLRQVQLRASPDDLDPRYRYGLQSRRQMKRLMRTILLWFVAVIFLFLAGLVVSHW